MYTLTNYYQVNAWVTITLVCQPAKTSMCYFLNSVVFPLKYNNLDFDEYAFLASLYCCHLSIHPKLV